MLSTLFFFFFPISLAVWGVVWVHVNLRIFCPISVRSSVGSLIGITLIRLIALVDADFF